MSEINPTSASRAKALPLAICVPVRNEAAVLPQLFVALERLERVGIAPRLCVLLDSCDDASLALVRDYAANASMPVIVEEVAAPDANAGRARHRAMMLGDRSLDGGGVLLTTDADSIPSRDWLQTIAAGLRQADVVAGKVVRTVTRSNPLLDRLEAYYDALHALRRSLDPVDWEGKPTHHYASGANLGLRVASYRSLGGFEPLANGEDGRLVDDAARAGLRVRRDATCVVHTSDRRLGRVAHGLAGTLRTLDRDGEAIDVADPRDAAWQYRGHGIARLAFATADFASLAVAVGLTIDHLVGVARDCPNAEAFAMRVVPTPPGGMRRVSLAIAEAKLAAITAGRRAA
ncbi:glycosyltransferase [Sphingomonas citri]|uniref:glycosyltransferase n=1 Tax=Sphingomonas citri TaxID=2862499 RepID=UPI0027E53D3A|nr:glycosyltransferase [Sphingomonas citri]